MNILRKLKSTLKENLESEWCCPERPHVYPIEHSRPEDVFIAGYPKSGNTWMQHLITGIVFGMDTKYLPDRLAQEVVPDVHAKKNYKRFKKIKNFKTHFRPKKRYKKVIHLLRDGRDVISSYYHYRKNEGKNIEIEEMIKKEKGLFPCSWEKHTREWLKNPYDAKIMRVKYESLKSQPMVELKRICSFIGVKRDDNLLKRVQKGCQFNEMKKRYDRYGHDNAEWPEDKDFLRKGKSESYKKEIPKKLLRYFEEKSEKVMKEVGYMSST